MTTARSRPATLAAVTTAGAVELLDPATGKARRTLATGATGDEIALTPNGATVYYEAAVGCTHQIDSVAAVGGASTMLADGSYPTISPDGTELAYAVQPLFTPDQSACQGSDVSPAAYSVVVRNLMTATVTRYPSPPSVIANGLPLPIDHLSWSPDGRRLAVSIAGGEDNEQWSLLTFDRASDNSYAPTGTSSVVVVVGPQGTYYREAVWLPNGDLFAARQCCAGLPGTVSSVELDIVNPATGATIQQVAVGFTSVDHTSLDSDGTGYWLLYLSGAGLLVSQGGARPTTLATGFQAAAWQ